MGKNKKVPARVSPKKSKKRARRKMPVIRRCAKCLERHEAPTGKKCARLQTPGVQVGTDPIPGPAGLFVPSSSAESVSAEEVRLASARFPSGSSTADSTPQRPLELPPQRMEEGQNDDNSSDGSSEVEEYEDGSEDESDDEASEDAGAEWENVSDTDHEGVSQALEFNRVMTQILDRLERSEARTTELEKMLEAERAKGHVDTRDTQFTRPPPVQRFKLPVETSSVAQPEALTNQPGLLNPPKSAGPRGYEPTTPRPTGEGNRIWDRWSWDTSTDQPTRDEAAGGAEGNSAQLPAGERPQDLRRDPFLKTKVQAFINKASEPDATTTGRSAKSGLVRTATDVVKFIIQRPHHVVFRNGQPVAYEALTPWEFVFSFMACIRHMEQTPVVLNTMLRHLYNFSFAASKQDWNIMRTAFQQVFIEIEAGRVNWTDFVPINAILEQAKFDLVARAQTEAKGQQKQPPQKLDGQTSSAKKKIRTCNKYQRGQCTDTQGHYAGKWFYHHVCASCYKTTGDMIYHPAMNCHKNNTPAQAAQNQQVVQQPPAESKNQAGAANRF